MIIELFKDQIRAFRQSRFNSSLQIVALSAAILVPNIVQANQILKAFKVNNKVSVEAMKEADEKAKEEWACSSTSCYYACHYTFVVFEMTKTA